MPTNAWLLSIDDEHALAIHQQQLIELLHCPKLTTIPLAPVYCCQLLAYQQQQLALMQPAVLLQVPEQTTTNELVVILGKTNASGSIKPIGAIALLHQPTLIDTNQLKPLTSPPMLNSKIEQHLLGSFAYQGKTVFIIDWPGLFSTPATSQPCL